MHVIGCIRNRIRFGFLAFSTYRILISIVPLNIFQQNAFVGETRSKNNNWILFNYTDQLWREINFLFILIEFTVACIYVAGSKNLRSAIVHDRKTMWLNINCFKGMPSCFFAFKMTSPMSFYWTKHADIFCTFAIFALRYKKRGFSRTTL